VRGVAASAASRGLRLHSPWWHATAYAVLGAVELLRVRPEDRAARGQLRAARARLLPGPLRASWPWPEQRLTYANAVLPDTLIALGTATGDEPVTRRGLDLLDWLLEVETAGDHLSPTPVGGRGPGDPRPAFDQQPIEVAALADACATAATVTGEPGWRTGVRQAIAWFLGDNDLGTPMWDPTTGGAYDGLTPHGPNLNQGAESTLALIATLQLGPASGAR
jgi:hypothetical protein